MLAKFLLFMLIGTLIFGFAFPAVLLEVFLFICLLPIFLISILIGLVTGRGSLVINGKMFDRFKWKGQKREKKSEIYDVPHDRDEHRTGARNHAVSIAELQEPSEIVDLDSDALKKE